MIPKVVTIRTELELAVFHAMLDMADNYFYNNFTRSVETALFNITKVDERREPDNVEVSSILTKWDKLTNKKDNMGY